MKRFQLHNLRAGPTKIPRACELHCDGVARHVEPPDVVTQHLSNELVVGVDVDTHDWGTNVGSKGGIGQYGFYTRCNSNIGRCHIVRLGWAISGSNAPTVTKERLVKPECYIISEKAEQHHGISNKVATQQGRDIRDVMEEFMDDMMTLYARGWRVVIHHIELDAGIISQELIRADMNNSKTEWESIARRGVCTMCPVLGRWVRQCLNIEISPNMSLNTMRLDIMLKHLAPDGTVSRSAGSDAEKHVILYFALQRLAKESE